MRITNVFRLTDLTDVGQIGDYLASVRRAKSLGHRWFYLRISGFEGSIAVAKAWHALIDADPSIAVCTRIEGLVGLPGYLVWLAGIGREVAPDAGVWFGNDIVPYSHEFRVIRQMMMSRMVFTDYDESRGYRLRTSLHYLLSTIIIGTRQLRDLHLCPIVALPP